MHYQECNEIFWCTSLFAISLELVDIELYSSQFAAYHLGPHLGIYRPIQRVECPCISENVPACIIYFPPSGMPSSSVSGFSGSAAPVDADGYKPRTVASAFAQIAGLGSHKR